MCPVEYCLESVEKYSEAQVYMSKPEPRNNNVNTVYIYLSAEIFKSVGQRLFETEQAQDCKCWLIVVLQAV